MPASAAPVVVEMRQVRKSYGALRPLRIADLVVRAGDRVALTGLDAVAAEVFVALLTGAALPETGEIRLFGRPTAAIADETDWFATLERIGLVSRRAVLLESLSVVQNLALPFTLEIDPLSPDVAGQVAALAAEVGIAPVFQAVRMGDVDPEVRARVHLGRALALRPALLVLEHPTADLPRPASARFGTDVARLARARDLAVLAITDDEPFARTLAHRTLAVDPATGVLRPH